MTTHLTEAQICNLLSEARTSEVAAAEGHLASCALCQQEFATMQHSFAAFRLAATNLSVLHTPPRPIVGVSIHSRFSVGPRLVWSAALGSVLAVSALTISTLHKANPSETPHAALVPVTTQASDEALLQDIDSDLSTPVPPSLQPLDTTPAAGAQTVTTTSN